MEEKQDNGKELKIRTVFMGTSPLAEAALAALIEKRYNIVGIFTQPDRKSGRDQEIKPNGVKALAVANNIPVFQPEKFDDANIDVFQNLKPDLVVVAAYGKLLPKKILETPGFGCVNIHPSLLPKFRGPSPVQNALMSGELETGLTIMLLNEQMDAGDILAQEKMTIEPDENTDDLFKKLIPRGVNLLIQTLPLWVERKIEPKPQDNSAATLCQLIEREDGRIIWEDSAESIYNKYRALFGWPGLFAFWQYDDALVRVKFHKISLQKENDLTPRQTGEVFETDGKLAIQTQKGLILLDELQLEGKNPMDAKSFANGYPGFVGSVLK